MTRKPSGAYFLSHNYQQHSGMSKSRVTVSRATEEAFLLALYNHYFCM